MRATTIEGAQGANPLVVALAAWLMPGAGHLWSGQRFKGLVFLVVLPAMFATGLALQGRLFPFELQQPLVALAAIADLGIGLPYFIAKATRVLAAARCSRSPTSTATRSSSSPGC